MREFFLGTFIRVASKGGVGCGSTTRSRLSAQRAENVLLDFDFDLVQ